MLDGFVFSLDKEPHTFLDRMNTKQLVEQSNYDNKPAHIDKLFMNED